MCPILYDMNVTQIIPEFPCVPRVPNSVISGLLLVIQYPFDVQIIQVNNKMNNPFW